MRFPRFLALVLWCTAAFVLADDFAATATADFAARRALPQTRVPEKDWYAEKYRGSWGPSAAVFPRATPPANVDAVRWQQTRVLRAAHDLIGLPYQHHHIPAWAPPAEWTSKLGGPETPGLDCSNFTAWVYNFALGIKFTSDINDQAESAAAPGRRLREGEAFAPGDLLFILQRDRARVSHVVLYVDAGHILDSHGSGVAVRPFSGWYRTHLSHARRVIE